MKFGKKREAPESLVAGSVGFEQKRGIPGMILGMLCRFAVAYIGAAGVCLMLNNAFTFDAGNYPGSVFFACLIFCAAWFLILVSYDLNRIVFASSAGLAGAALILGISRIGLKASFGYVPISLWNSILTRLDNLGFTALTGLKAQVPECDPTTADGAFYAKIGFYAFCALASLAFVSCLYKKVRAVPVIITAGTVMTLTFTYNLLNDNLGFVMTVSSGVGMLVLLYCSAFTKDKTAEVKKSEKKKATKTSGKEALAKASSSGFAAFLAAATVLAVAAYPASRINSAAPEFDLLSGVIDEARDIFSAYLTGDPPVYDDYDVPKKSTEPTPHAFRDKKLITVTASYPTAVYLRAWVSDSYSNNKWASSSSSNVGVSVLPEEITELFYTVVDIDANVIADREKADTGCADRGFIKEYVTVKSDALSGGTGLLASRYSTLYGITEPNSGESYKKGYRLKEGVGTAELSMRGAAYGTAAYSANYRNVVLSKLDNDMIIYETVLPHIKDYARMKFSAGVSDDQLQNRYLYADMIIKETLASHSLYLPAGSLWNRLRDMRDDDLSAFMKKLDEIEKYENYVYENCVSVPWSDEATLNTAAVSAFGGGAGERPSEIFAAANKTARYLAKICEYDLSPEGYTDRGSYVAQFLTTAKSGYCVQYASAAALMLRTAGIPTRYVDGFLAADFHAKAGRYECEVLDSNAHAWIEAYVRGYGWMTFEMTAPMLDGMYRKPGEGGYDPVVTDTLPAETTAPPDTTAEDPETTPPVTTPPETVTDPGTTTDDGTQGQGHLSAETVLTAGIIVLCVLVLSTIIYIFLRTTSGRAKKRRRMLQTAANGESADPEKDIDETARYIFYLLGKLKMKKKETELMADFVKRVDTMTQGGVSFAPAADAIQKNSFGHCAGKDDCKTAAEYAIYLHGFTVSRLKLVKKMWYCEVIKRI